MGMGSPVVLVDILLACCGLEIEAAIPATALEVDGDAPASHRVVTVSGTVTNALALDVAAAVQASRTRWAPTTVVALSVRVLRPAARTGTPYSVLKGLDQIVEVEIASSWAVLLLPPRSRS